MTPGLSSKTYKLVGHFSHEFSGETIDVKNPTPKFALKRPGNLMINLYMILMSGVLILPQPAQTQTRDKATFKYEVGLELASVRDDLLIPLAFSGPGIVLGLGAHKEHGLWEWSVDSRLRMDFIANRFSHPGASTALDIEPSLLRHVCTSPWDFNIYTGPSLRYQMNNQFIFSWDDAHLYWTTVRGLNLDLSMRKQLNSNRLLSLDISIPLYSQISRPDAQRLEKQDPSLMSLGFFPPSGSREFTTGTYHSYRSVGFEIKLQNSISGSTWLLGFDFDHYTYRDDVRIMSTSLSYQKQISRTVKS